MILKWGGESFKIGVIPYIGQSSIILLCSVNQILSKLKQVTMDLFKKTLFVKTLFSVISLITFNLLAQPISSSAITEGEHLLRRYLSILKMQSQKMEEDCRQQMLIVNTNN
jgi:hypothetical protein